MVVKEIQPSAQIHQLGRAINQLVVSPAIILQPTKSPVCDQDDLRLISGAAKNSIVLRCSAQGVAGILFPLLTQIGRPLNRVSTQISLEFVQG
jgi:hypothetical protein